MDAAMGWKSCGRPSRRIRRRTSSPRSEEHTSELQSRSDLVCRLLLEKKKKVILPQILAERMLVEQELLVQSTKKPASRTPCSRPTRCQHTDSSPQRATDALLSSVPHH